jgi:RND family efflux transporter MFP subunit
MFWAMRSASADNGDSTAGRSSDVVPAVSSPSDQRTLTFDQMHKIKEIKLKEGDEVKAGDLLVEADSDVEQAHYEAMRIVAESKADIAVAKADYDYKKDHANHVADAAQKGAASAGDVDEANEAFLEAQAKVDQANDQQKERVAELTEQGKKVEEMKIFSPIDGVVAKVSLRAGEIADPNKNEGAITIVQISPVWVDAHIISARAAKLKLGDVLQVAYANEPDHWIDGKIIFLSPVVDAASDKQMVRLEVPNPQRKPAGLAVNIRLNPTVASAK